MKILHIIPGLEIMGGGANRACAELCQAQAELGHEVTIAHVDKSRAECFRPANVTVKKFPARFLSSYAYSPELKKYLQEAVPDFDIVHIHATWQYPNIPASKYVHRYRTPYIIQPHGNLHPWKLNYKSFRKKMYWHFIEKRILENAAFIHVESEVDKSDVKSLLPEAKTVISPCGVFEDNFRIKNHQNFIREKWPIFRDKKVLLYLARLDINKGIDLLLKSFAKLAGDNKQWNLLIVGPDYADTTSKMQKLAHQLDISERIAWAGMVSEQERILIMQGCDIYVLPSLSENFGISVLEAMFCSKPVLTTNKTSWTELENNNAGVIVSVDVDGITNGLMKMFNMPIEHLRSMGQNALNLARSKYSWPKIAEKLLVEYEQVIRN